MECLLLRDQIERDQVNGSACCPAGGSSALQEGLVGFFPASRRLTVVFPQADEEDVASHVRPITEGNWIALAQTGLDGW